MWQREKSQTECPPIEMEPTLWSNVYIASIKKKEKNNPMFSSPTLSVAIEVREFTYLEADRDHVIRSWPQLV